MSFNSAKSPSHRRLRVAEEVRHALAHVFERGEVRNETLRDAVITITEVRMSSDLRKAIVYFRPLGVQADLPAVTAAMRTAQGFLRRRVGDALRLKFIPDLEMRVDDSFDEAQRIEQLLRDPKVRQDLSDPSEPAAPTSRRDA